MKNSSSLPSPTNSNPPLTNPHPIPSPPLTNHPLPSSPTTLPPALHIPNTTTLPITLPHLTRPSPLRAAPVHRPPHIVTISPPIHIPDSYGILLDEAN